MSEEWAGWVEGVLFYKVRLWFEDGCLNYARWKMNPAFMSRMDIDGNEIRECNPLQS